MVPQKRRRTIAVELKAMAEQMENMDDLESENSKLKAEIVQLRNKGPRTKSLFKLSDKILSQDLCEIEHV